MNIMLMFTSFSVSRLTREICQNRDLSKDPFQRTFIDNFFHPIQPFLNYLCNNRRRLTACQDSFKFSTLFGYIIEYSPFLEQITQFMLSSSFPMAFTSCLDFFEKEDLTFILLRSVLNGLRQWRNAAQVVRKRGQQIVSKLNEEGYLDEIELHFQWNGIYVSEHRTVFPGVRLLVQLGANATY
ncbi:hypothetical protein BLNAU_17670 [Blattamonas nauphoetae]|uniref:Uncharacterized protein n=1 Tax=Blattamonas nauphoetae TaxID=2049346 RepID=A0ABQ9X969_9EUKA|nr:hypothetical protein BLNAU_17670 [Blattamonas nauphoetae]